MRPPSAMAGGSRAGLRTWWTLGHLSGASCHRRMQSDSLMVTGPLLTVEREEGSGVTWADLLGVTFVFKIGDKMSCDF